MHGFKMCLLWLGLVASGAVWSLSIEEARNHVVGTYQYLSSRSASKMPNLQQFRDITRRNDPFLSEAQVEQRAQAKYKVLLKEHTDHMNYVKGINIRFFADGTFINTNNNKKSAYAKRNAGKWLIIPQGNEFSLSLNETTTSVTHTTFNDFNNFRLRPWLQITVHSDRDKGESSSFRKLSAQEAKSLDPIFAPPLTLPKPPTNPETHLMLEPHRSSLLALPNAAYEIAWANWLANSAVEERWMTSDIRIPMKIFKGSFNMGHKIIDFTLETGTQNLFIPNYPSWEPATSFADALNIKNAPNRKNGILKLFGGDNVISRLSFSEPVVNPIFSFWSIGSTRSVVGFNFQNASPLLVTGGASTEYSGGTIAVDGTEVRGAEANGSVILLGQYQVIQWTNPEFENWFGFNVGLPIVDDTQTSQ